MKLIICFILMGSNMCLSCTSIFISYISNISNESGNLLNISTFLIIIVRSIWNCLFSLPLYLCFVLLFAACYFHLFWCRCFNDSARQLFFQLRHGIRLQLKMLVICLCYCYLFDWLVLVSIGCYDWDCSYVEGHLLSNKCKSWIVEIIQSVSVWNQL